MSGGAADLAVAGLGTGAVAALSGLGVLATYRVTGVLNVAFGAVGMFGAYLVRALVVDAHLPDWIAGVLVVCVFAPLLGLVLEAVVFGPLQARAADPARLLTAGFGVTVLLVGLATAIWGQQARTDAPTLLPGGTARIAGVDVPAAVPIELVLVILVALGIAWFSRGGPAVRAVIDDRRLAELAGLPARRLARIGWATGTMLAAATGVLLAPQLRFDPTTLTLVLFETLGVAIAARLRSAPIAILAAFATAICQAELTGVHLSGAAGPVVDAVRSNLFVVLLLFATWLTPAFDTPQAVARRVPGAEHLWPPYLWVLAIGVAGWVLRPTDLRAALQIPALALVLLSFRVLNAGGLLSLGQAGLAGIGALTAGWTASGWGLPAAPIAGGLVAVVFALPVLRQAGLHLAVATLAAATALSSFLFDQPLFTPSSVPRPGFAQPDKSYLYFELVIVVLVLAALTVLVRGPLALRLSALRESEPAARTAGIAVDLERLVVFAGAGAVAALGGALWAAGDQVFDPTTFEPAQGLLWFAAAAAVGFADPAALILTAVVLVVADTYIAGSAAILVGLATLVLPGLRWEGRGRAAPGPLRGEVAPHAAGPGL
jgi:branched-chain amino acid transport system permease protein